MPSRFTWLCSTVLFRLMVVNVDVGEV
jgi:hypothetical protein